MTRREVENLPGNGSPPLRSPTDDAVLSTRNKPRARAGAAVLALAAGALSWTCTAGGEEIQPPARDFYFPTGLSLSPDGRVLGVVSANSDLRYDTGTLNAVDVGAVRDVLDEWRETGEVPVGRDCEQTPSEPYELACEASEVIPEGASVRIGNFATDLDFQELSEGRARAFVPVRGEPSVTWIDVDTESLDLECAGEGAHPACGDEHKLQQARPDADPEGDLGALPAEPFGVFVDGASEYAVVTHLEGAGLSLVRAPREGEGPQLADVVTGLFGADAQGRRSAVGAAARRPGAPDSGIYVTSRSDSVVRTLHVASAEDSSRLVEGSSFDLQRLAPPSDDARGIAFGAEGDRAYIVNRDPPALQLFNTETSAAGSPANEAIGTVGLCREGSTIEVADAGRGERAYVACFASGEIWAIDPHGRAVEAIIQTDRGPDGLAASEEEGLLFVANFLDDSLVVIDIEAGSETENRPVLRFGMGERRDS